jgi:uncharacterized protein (DUF1330 family)
MAKAYWVSCYQKIMDPAKLSAYAKLAGPAIQESGGRFLARGVASKSYEAGLLERVVIIEFESLEKAISAHGTPAYQKALGLLEGGVVRDLRIVEGI